MYFPLTMIFRALRATPRGTPQALWSAATGRRFVRLADLSAKQRRAERREKLPEPTASVSIACLNQFDGDKSPAKSGDESPHSKRLGLMRPYLAAFSLS